MRALLGVITIASSVAHAEPPPNKGSLRASIQPTFAILSRTTRYASYDERFWPSGTDTMSGSGMGGRVEVGFGRRIASTVQLGGVLRLGYHTFDVRFGDGTRDVMVLRPVQIGPQITVEHERLFFRADLTLGSLPSVMGTAGYDMSSDGVLGMVGAGVEVGYQVPLGAASTAQLGFGASVAGIRSNERADHGEYIDRTYLIAMAATISAVRTF